ncbi:MAG: GNAT family N-acetyltransferase [Bacteroidales bacterium]|nr:GNAT family N-acetyltransferase [Bacteroidales bacterium]
MKEDEKLLLRREVRNTDPSRVEIMVRSTGFFRDDETAIAVELVVERIRKGPESGYEFLFADMEGETVAYSCYGLIPCTLHSYDLYWIVTHSDFMNQGIGRKILGETERLIRESGGTGIYVETSSKDQYAPTRAFYERNSYLLKARFENFYDLNDDKLVYVKYI